MKPQTILKVEKEVERFKDALNDLYIESGKLECEPLTSVPDDIHLENGKYNISKAEFIPVDLEGRYTAALKRASMDLTRALADLRQGR